jgi:hypothetical protein
VGEKNYKRKCFNFFQLSETFYNITLLIIHIIKCVLEHIRHVHRCPGAQAPIDIIMGYWAPIRILDFTGTLYLPGTEPHLTNYTFMSTIPTHPNTAIRRKAVIYEITTINICLYLSAIYINIISVEKISNENGELILIVIKFKFSYYKLLRNAFK